MKKLILGLSVIFMVLVSGCVTISIESKVGRDGGIAKYDMMIDTSATVYSLMDDYDEGESLQERVESQGGTYKEEWDKDNVRIIMTDIVPEDVHTEVGEDYLIYRETFGELPTEGVNVHYYLEMPGKIVESNADSVDGNKAEWHMVGADSGRDIYAKSEVPALPGISAFSIIGILLIVALIRR